jgi:CheY-like chemotaxis protein
MEALGRLAGGVAHDFNNLLTIILGYSDLALQNRPEDDRPYSGLTQIRKAGERGSALTRHLLAFSRKQPLQPVVLNLNTVLADVETMLQRLLGADIDIVLATDSALGAVQADPGQIEQVLLNLAVNARDAMPQGGTLTIETTNVTLAESLPAGLERLPLGAYVLLAVSDTGCGMDANTQAHIFEPFFTTKEPGKGTGLGLSTVYGIVEQSRGHITVASAPGQGATFRMYLPRVKQRPTTLTPRSPHSASRQGSETILLVEDEPGVRALLSTSLQQHGYNVLEAEHGAAALQVSVQHAGPIHLLVTDIVMPQISGPELAARLKTTRPEMRTLFLSGYTGDAIDHDSILDSTTMLLLKPIVPSAFERAVRTVLEAPAPS